MWKLKKLYCPRYFCYVLVAFLTLLLAVKCTESKDFICTNILPDGEVETRINYRGVTAKETIGAKGLRSGLRFRQLTDGKHLIQLIYGPDFKLIDCEFGHQKGLVKMFLYNFKNESNLLDTLNVTKESLVYRQLPIEIRSWFNYKKLRRECKRKHTTVKEYITVKNLENKDSSDFRKEKRKHSKKNINNNETKRGISDLLRVPGTKWCGKGYSADKYTRLGGFSRTDKCCRKHDLSCPFWIGGLQQKYGLMNWRINTLMHCNCDESFRACLKTVRSSEANLVGKLFFNVVQTQCFILKPQKQCVRHSWWGKCEKYKFLKQAVLKDNLPY